MLNNKVEICGVNTSKLPILKKEEKKELFDKILQGDEEAREKYIYGNLRLVLSIIQRFNNRGEYVDDIFQVGCIGLIKAIDNFDITQGVQFSTYAVPMNIKCRKIKRGSKMTRKQALQAVIQLLENDKQIDETVEIIHKVNEIIKDMPLNHWSEKAIFDSFEQFAIDNGRNVKTRDMKQRSNGLPPHTVIKLRFGVEAKFFLDSYYPTISKCSSKIYGNKTKEQWLEIFIKEYERVKPTSGEQYNKLRQKGLPSWQFVSKLFKIQLWSKFQDFCKLPTYIKHKVKLNSKQLFNTNSFTNYDEEIAKQFHNNKQ